MNETLAKSLTGSSNGAQDFMTHHQTIIQSRTDRPMNAKAARMHDQYVEQMLHGEGRTLIFVTPTEDGPRRCTVIPIKPWLDARKPAVRGGRSCA